MDPVASYAAPTRRPRRWRVLAVLLGILALALGASGWARLAGPPDQPARGPATPVAHPTAEAPATVTAQPQGMRPTHLRIPSIDVSATVTSLGIRPDRTVEVPGDPDQAGWYRLGSRPGESGSAVILGHVDSTKGPAVFYRLRSLTAGDEVDVQSSDGSVVRFAVSSIATYANADFPARKVYRTAGRPGLALVTCGGSYDAARGGYQANVVVYAVLAGSSR